MSQAKNRVSVIVLLGCMLTACISQPPATRPIDVRALEQQAERSAQSGDTQRAAALYDQLASATSGAARSAYLIEAAQQAIAAGDAAGARRRLTDARTAADREQQQAVDVLLAGIEVGEGRPQAALTLLDALPQSSSLFVQREGAAVRARALFALRRYAEAVRALIAREVWLDTPAAIDANQRLIWESFRNTPPRPGEAAPTTGDRIVDGWLALAPIASASESEQRAALLAWRDRYPTHPAARRLLGLLANAGGTGAFPRQIALLLPVSSPRPEYRFPAETIRDAFLFGYLEDPSHASTAVRVYDTALGGAASAYQTAQADGAELIVGPLLRQEVEQVIPLLGTVPTIALNLAPADATLPRSFFQFSLAPEDEARAVARRAIADGKRNAVALVPYDSPARILAAFRDEFTALGGRVLEERSYDRALGSLAPEITALFNIVDSNGRKDALQERLGALGVQLEFRPRYRQDVDMVFVIADSIAGAALNEELAYHPIEGVSVYATADVFRDTTAPPNFNLDGIVFADAPIVIAADADAPVKRQFAQFWPKRAEQGRYFGMGYDAYGLVQLVSSGGIQASPLQGLSGDLRLDADGRVHRDLPTARFTRGRPVPLPRADAASARRAMPGGVATAPVSPTPLTGAR